MTTFSWRNAGLLVLAVSAATLSSASFAQDRDRDRDRSRYDDRSRDDRYRDDRSREDRDRSANRDRDPREEERVIKAFLNQEKEFWELESRLLQEALDAVKSEKESRSEREIRKIIRAGRSTSTLKQVKRFIDEHLDPTTRSFLRDISDANGNKPEDVYADYITTDATIDYALMASAYNTVQGNNLSKFPEEAQRLLRELVGTLRKRPVPSNDIQVGRIEANKLDITVFGCQISERVDSVIVERRDSALLSWRSNYYFLRDLKDRNDPKERREETLVYDRDRDMWTVSYVRELEEFVDITGRADWGKKVRELADIDGYLQRRDPLDEKVNKRSRLAYDNYEDNDSSTRWTGGRDDRSDRDRDDRRR